MLLGNLSSAKFEAGCIGFHLAQARSNLSSLGPEGKRRDRAGDFLQRTQSAFDLHRPRVGAPWESAQAAFEPQARLPEQRAFLGHARDLGSEPDVGTMISSIAQRLHEELHSSLAAFSTRLAAHEAALAASADRGDFGLDAMSRGLDAQLEEAVRVSAARRDADMQVLRENLTKLERRVDSHNLQVDSVDAGEDWSRKLKEVTRVFEQKVALQAEAGERRLHEVQTAEATRQRTWREALMQRCDTLEQRLTKRFKDSTSLADQVMQVMPDAEHMRELHDQLMAERSASDTWQRRLIACESIAQRVAGLEAQLAASDKQVVRSVDEHSQLMREHMHQQTLAGTRVSALERFVNNSEQHFKAIEQRMVNTLDQHQRRSHNSVDNLRESMQLRFTDIESRSFKRLEKMRDDFEHRCTDLAHLCQTDTGALSSKAMTVRLNTNSRLPKPSVAPHKPTPGTAPARLSEHPGSELSDEQPAVATSCEVHQPDTRAAPTSSIPRPSSPVISPLDGVIHPIYGHGGLPRPLSPIISPLDGRGHPIYGQGRYEVAEQGLYVRAKDAKVETKADDRQQHKSNRERPDQMTSASGRPPSPETQANRVESATRDVNMAATSEASTSRARLDEIDSRELGAHLHQQEGHSCQMGADVVGSASHQQAALTASNATASEHTVQHPTRTAQASVMAEEHDSSESRGGCFPNFAVGSLDLEASQVFSEADDLSFHPSESDNADLAPEPLGAGQPDGEVADRDAGSQAARSEQPCFSDDDSDEDLEAVMLRSMKDEQSQAKRGAMHDTEYGKSAQKVAAVSGSPDVQTRAERQVPQTEPQSTLDDSDEDDIEAMMLNSMADHQSKAKGDPMPVAESVHTESNASPQGDTAKSPMQVNLPAEFGTGPAIAAANVEADETASRAPRKEHSSCLDDSDDEDIEAMMLNSMNSQQRQASGGLMHAPTSVHNESDSFAQEASALMSPMQSAARQAPQTEQPTCSDGDDSDEDDIEAMMLKSMNQQRRM